MTERRYNDQEVAAIFELATEAQAGAKRLLPSGEGLTLSGLQDIGREIGIAPEIVARAAASLERRGITQTRRMLGLPVGVSRAVDLGRKLSDSEWDLFVSRVRATFDATGRTRSEGGMRLWSNGNLRVSLEPTPAGHQLRMRTMRSQSVGLIGGGLALVATSGILTVVYAILGRLGEQKAVSGIAILAAMGVGVVAWGAAALPSWARRRRQQMQELVERLTQAE